MFKYVVVCKMGYGVVYLTQIINGRPYFSKDKSIRQEFPDLETAQKVAKECREYSGNNWRAATEYRSEGGTE